MKVNEETEDEFDVHGYRRSNVSTAFFAVLCVLTCGIVWLLARWWPVKRTRFTHVECELREADIVVIHAIDKQVYVQEVKDISLRPTNISLDNLNNESISFEANLVQSGNMRYVEHLYLRYYITDEGLIHELSGYDNFLTATDIARSFGKHVDLTSLHL